MRIVSWNMGYWEHQKQHPRAWELLLAEIKPDIALVQEAIVPANLLEEGTYQVLFTEALQRDNSSKGLHWGSSILSRVGGPETALILSPEDIRKRGAVQIARCSVEGLGNVSIVNIHSRLNDNMVVPTLRETFDVIRPQLQERFIVGGDFNTGRTLEAAYPGYGHGDFWKEVESGPLKEAFPGDDGGERQSYWGEGDDNKGPTGNTLQDDHVLFDAETIKLVSESRIWDTPELRELSDHGPVVVDLQLP